VLLPVNNEDGFFHDKTITYNDIRADSIMALINNENITFEIASDYTVFTSVKLNNQSFQIIRISNYYKHILIDQFENDKLDWSSSLLLYQMYNLQAFDFIKYKSDIKKWRLEKKHFDFYRLYFYNK
jgi:hypothetical protein